VLELGSGSGANAAAVLDSFPDVRLTTTDLDPAMVDAAARRLAEFGDRVTVRQADAARLEFGDCEFDPVLSLLMLHHVGDWPAALAESARVVRSGGQIVGYDLLRSGPTAWLHRHRGPEHDYVIAEELHNGLAHAGFRECHRKACGRQPRRPILSREASGSLAEDRTPHLSSSEAGQLARVLAQTARALPTDAARRPDNQAPVDPPGDRQPSQTGLGPSRLS
jgi:SAM-dependent methyltransferase